jgi:hypothetical protein
MVMAKNEVITEAMIEAALALLEKRIAEPPPPSTKSYSRRDAFLKLKGRAKEALAAGHSLETVLDDLKGIGIGMTISTARQYLKPGRKTKRSSIPSATEPKTEKAERTVTKPPKDYDGKLRGTFGVTEDDKNI